MASTRFSTGLVSLYPREGDELQLLLEKHGVAFGRPEAIYSFPETLNGNPALQGELAGFVAESRSHPRGPVSRGAMLHLLLTGIGGPDAVSLGPEADAATNSITRFLEGLGGWPEDAFADLGDLGSEDSFGVSSASAPNMSANGSRPRSIAASLASQNGHHFEDVPPADVPRSSLEQIVLALGRLEESHRATSAKLDQIDTRLRRMEDVGGQTSPVLGETPASSETNDPTDFLVGARTILPTPALSQRSHPADEPFVPTTEQAEIPAMLAAAPPAYEIAPAVLPPFDPEPPVAWTPLTDPLSTPAPASLNAVQAGDASATYNAPAGHRTPQATPSGQKWKELFAEQQPKPKRSIAVVPVVIACLVFAAAIVAGLIYFLHNEGAAPEPVSDSGSRSSLSEPASGQSEITPNPAPRTAQDTSRAQKNAQTAQNQPLPSASGKQDRVLGARETFQPHSSAELYPQPRQPSFVAASTMESRLVYAPPPQHPRIAGLVGLTGMVVMEVIVDSDGTVETVKVLGGHHLLRDAAVNAVRTWRFRPVLQNGRPVPVRTIVRMDFNKEATQAKN